MKLRSPYALSVVAISDYEYVNKRVWNAGDCWLRFLLVENRHREISQQKTEMKMMKMNIMMKQKEIEDCGVKLRLFLVIRRSKSNNNKAATADGENALDTIHVFSLASGHLYERLLRIMMLSVRKRTSGPIKFWLVENFLSPQFKESIQFMASEMGFDVGLVTYKWPNWLRRQTEKQRIIWGYKILFLDVLFPLNVPKIITVDADQVVRADLRELWQMDLEGAPYGYTPFCTSRKETLGFQFGEKDIGKIICKESLTISAHCTWWI